MNRAFIFLAISILCPVLGKASTIAIPDKDIALIQTSDYVQIVGTNDLGGAENFDIHNIKAIREFIGLLTSDRFTVAPKSLKPQFKSLSRYKVRLFCKGSPVIELSVIADSVLDLPDDPMFYVEGDSYSANLMAPLLRLR